ncbi:MAG: hypothetical protein QOG80_1519, partial [Pseudonocardiales bacterium]|nr:hypothetical protein [Pseudonocardiales bacterium]
MPVTSLGRLPHRSLPGQRSLAELPSGKAWAAG